MKLSQQFRKFAHNQQSSFIAAAVLEILVKTFGPALCAHIKANASVFACNSTPLLCTRAGGVENLVTTLVVIIITAKYGHEGNI